MVQEILGAQGESPKKLSIFWEQSEILQIFLFWSSCWGHMNWIHSRQGTAQYVHFFYCKFEIDSNFYAKYSNMIGLLAKIIRTSNSFKNVLRYFGKVWRKLNLCILWFDWLIALYIFTPLPRNASFLIVKHSCVREELSDVVFFFRHNFNRSLCKINRKT